MVEERWVTARAEPLRHFSKQLLMAGGAPEDIAALVARHLVDGNLCGHDSHGVLRIPTYIDAIKRGNLVPDARPVVERETVATVLLDGKRGYGYTAMEVAITQAMHKARASGVATVAIRNCGHIGRLGGWAEAMALGGFASEVTVGMLGPGTGHAPPFGGATRTLSTNPWALGIPAKANPPVIADFATTSVAEGKLKFARAKKSPVPLGWIVDTQGKPTADVEEFYRGGMLLPFGGHKGSGMSIFASMLGGLSGEGGNGKIGGTMIVAFDPGAFGDADAYLRRVDAAIATLKAVPPADGIQEVLVPGEPETRSRAQRNHDGIPLPAETWRELKVLAAQHNVAVPEVA
jgi:LDH2 family malate/lactate/ureidoglycolate dehydrogenase